MASIKNIERHFCSLQSLAICGESLDLEPKYAHIVAHTLLDRATIVRPVHTEVSTHYTRVEQEI